jgi:hypothetical protein
MSEPIPAAIHIGGKIRRSVAEKLCPMITEQHVALEWGEKSFAPAAPDALLEARTSQDEGPMTLKLFDEQASYGHFPELEAFLQEHQIPYTRWSDPKYEFDGLVVHFRPSQGVLEWKTDAVQNPVVRADAMEPIAAQLTELLQGLRQGAVRAAEVPARIERLQKMLCEELPPNVPPLEALEITEDPQQAADTPGDARNETIRRLSARLEGAGLECRDLDNLVHDLVAGIAADVNNGGLDGQLAYLIDQLGAEHAERQIDELIQDRKEEDEDEA